MSDTALPAKDDSLVDRLLSRPDSLTFECKRIGKIDKLLESIIALANSEGGIVALGLEQGLLIVVNPEAGRNVRRYTLPDLDLDDEFFSNPDGKEPP